MSEQSVLIAIAVVEDNGNFLIGQRPNGVPLAGLWEFPGGKVEANESAENAARRECLEETSVEIEVVGEYPTRVQEYAHGRVELRFFACRPTNEAQLPCLPFCWVPRNELSRYEFPEGNRELLKILTQ